MKKFTVNVWGRQVWLDDRAFENDIQQYINDNEDKIKEQAEYLGEECFDEDEKKFMEEVLENLKGFQDEQIESLYALHLIDDLVEFVENIENN